MKTTDNNLINNDLTTEYGVKALMESSASESEWNANCDKVKRANGGYPGFWYRLIILGGSIQQWQMK
jgi:hypothetical protein